MTSQVLQDEADKIAGWEQNSQEFAEEMSWNTLFQLSLVYSTYTLFDTKQHVVLFLLLTNSIRKGGKKTMPSWTSNKNTPKPFISKDFMAKHSMKYLSRHCSSAGDPFDVKSWVMYRVSFLDSQENCLHSCLVFSTPGMCHHVHDQSLLSVSWGWIHLHLVIQQMLLSRAIYSKYRDIPPRQVGWSVLPKDTM